MNVTLGTDPEFLIEKQAGGFISALTLFPYLGKEVKIDFGNGFTLYPDGVALEGTVPPADDKEQFLNTISRLKGLAGKILGKKHHITFKSSHTFSPSQLLHQEARVAGCHPEFCVYKMAECDPPVFQKGFRSAGGHIHIGRKDFRDPNSPHLIDVYSKLDMIKLMDIFVGAPLALLDQSIESKNRKSLYGKMGRCRATVYGVEYRTPSNYWLSSPAMINYVWDATNYAANVLWDNQQNQFQFEESFLRDALDGGDTKKLTTIIKTLPKSLKKAISKL